MNSTGRYQPLRKAHGWAMFLSLAIVFLATVAHFAMIRRSLGREIVTLERTHDRLHVMADRWATEAKQAEFDRRVVAGFLRHCRTVEDIPDYQGNRIVARRQSLETLILYVPAGSHRLEISSTWQPSSSLEPAKVDEPAGAGSGEKNWSVPLLPCCGYLLRLVPDRQGAPIKWELTCNHAEFKTQSESIPLDGFMHSGSSWSGTDVVQFPNQIDWSIISKIRKTATMPDRGIDLMEATLRGPVDNQPYEVTLKVRLNSDRPVCVTASEAQRMIMLKREFALLPYEGGGKYTIDTAKLAPK
jgi:hypothetical protein